MKTILYSVSTGYFARNLLRTGVIEKLLDSGKVRIVIVTPGYNDEEFLQELPFRDKVVFEKMHEVDRAYDFMDRLIWKSWNLGHVARIFEKVYKFLLNIQLKNRYYKKFHQFYGRIFDQYKPDFVIGATPGVNSRRDIPVFVEAQARGIKTMALIHSWDNIAKRKGPMWVRPDILGVWNRFQKEEAVKANFYKDEDVLLLGAPHFDIYWRDETFMGRDAFFKKMGIDPRKKLVTVIVTAQNLVDNTYIVDILLDAFKKNKFTLPVQLLCRPLPRARPEDNDRRFGKYYDNPDIIIDREIQFLPTVGWNPNQEQLRHFANLVKYSDVQVSIVSTATIEAAILDRPVVNVDFGNEGDNQERERFRKLIKESKNSSHKNHFAPVIKSGAAYMPRDSRELIDNINDYLLHPDRHRQERKNLKKEMLYKADGRAIERITRIISEFTG